MQNVTNVESSMPILLPGQNHSLQDFYYLFASIDFLFNPSSVLLYHFFAVHQPISDYAPHFSVNPLRNCALTSFGWNLNQASLASLHIK